MGVGENRWTERRFPPFASAVLDTLILAGIGLFSFLIGTGAGWMLLRGLLRAVRLAFRRQNTHTEGFGVEHFGAPR
jgi:hypothetical protein